MAENRCLRRAKGSLEFSADTSVPAAEVLIDLKESARRRRDQEKCVRMRPVRVSPRKKKGKIGVFDSPRKTPNHHSSSRRLEFSNDSSGFQNSEEEEEEEEEEEQEEEEAESCTEDISDIVPSQKKTKRLIKAHVFKQTIPPVVMRPDQATLVTLHTVSSKLRNLLKLPKAHKWCYYEWFYSDIDQPLLECENDFCRCLSEMFPDLKTSQLTRVQWRYLRRLMGKPRRCSSTFFMEERALLDHRRKKVRLLQQQVHQGQITAPDFATYKDVPDYIPQLLVVGTVVTARLHTERESGFYTGRIEAVDLDNHQYWVTFDRPGLGKHPIPDTEIKAAESPEMICISKLEASQLVHWPPKDHSSLHTSFHPRTPPRSILSDSAMHAALSPELLQPDPFLTSSPERRKLLSEPQRLPGTSPLPQTGIPDQVGGFPVDLLRQVMQLSKLLSLKQQIIGKLSLHNKEAERAHARQKPVDSGFQRQYAVLVVDLDDINKQLNQRLDSIRSHCDRLGYGSEINPHMDVREQASKITENANNSLQASGSGVKDPHLLSLVSKLTGLLLQIEVLSESATSLQVNTLSQSVEEIGQDIHPINRRHFRDNVETPVTLIQSGMSPVGTLHAFSTGRTFRNS